MSVHRLGCKAGLTGSHIASVLFYLEATTRIHEKLTCTQVKCSWIFADIVNEMPYARAKNIDFSSVNNLRSKKSSTRKLRIYNSRKNRTSSFYFHQLLVLGLHRPAHQRLSAFSAHRRLRKKMDQLYAKVKQCKIKAVALSLIDPFADQFID